MRWTLPHKKSITKSEVDFRYTVHNVTTFTKCLSVCHRFSSEPTFSNILRENSRIFTLRNTRAWKKTRWIYLFFLSNSIFLLFFCVETLKRFSYTIFVLKCISQWGLTQLNGIIWRFLAKSSQQGTRQIATTSAKEIS